MILKLRTFPLAIALLAIVLAPAAIAGDSIDFTKPPTKGAKFKVTENSNFLINVEGEANGQTFEVKTTMTGKEVFTHKILEVTDGKVSMIEREYEDAGMKQVTEAPMFPEPQEQEQESELAWKVVRAKWDGDTYELKLKDGDDWKAADEKISSKLTSKSLRTPMLPLPDGTKSVGESWELDSDELKSYFPSEQFGGSAGADISGEFKATLKSIQEIDGLECGVIEFNLKISVETGEGPTMDFTLKGTANYSTKHCFVMSMKATGKMTSEFEGEQQGVQVSQKINGNLKVTTKTKVVTQE